MSDLAFNGTGEKGKKKTIVNVEDLTNEKFTQGEWRANQRPHGKVSIVGDNGQQVCLMWNSKERDANCDLISAAPEMYRALRKMIDMHIEDFGCDGLDSEVIDEACAALAKAKATPTTDLENVQERDQ